MQYYMDVTLLPCVDIGIHFLWEKVFQKIHIGFVESQNNAGEVLAGIALPEYNEDKNQLGRKLRIFANEEAIFESLKIAERLKNFSDYVHITKTRLVPEGITNYACYKRLQPKSNKERIARRLAKRKGIELLQARELLRGTKERMVKTPYINVYSKSSGKRFRLIIQREIRDQLVSEPFTSYGLSKTGTVPEF